MLLRPRTICLMPCKCSAARSLHIAIACLILLGSLSAEPIGQLKATGYVNDFAHVLSADSISYLEHLCAEVDQKAKSQIAIVTIHSLDGRDVEGYAVDLYKAWGIGSK